MNFIDFLKKFKVGFLIIGIILMMYGQAIYPLSLIGFISLIFSIIGFIKDTRPSKTEKYSLPGWFKYHKEVMKEDFVKCPVCKSPKIERTEVKNKISFICEKCRTKFNKTDESYYKIDSKETSKEFKDYQYFNCNLSVYEWNHIAINGNTLREKYINQIKNGNIPSVILEGVDLTGLKQDEKSFYGEATKMSEPRAIRNTIGFHAKGVWWSRGESHQELKEICSGTLILTNKRLVFTSDLRTSNIELKKIINIITYNDGIMIQMENRQKPQFFSVSDSELWGAFLSGALAKK
jgi:ribosomal protein L37AE/L43A